MNFQTLDAIERLARTMAPPHTEVRVQRSPHHDLIEVRATTKIDGAWYGCACAFDRQALRAFRDGMVIRDQLEHLFHELKRAPRLAYQRASAKGFHAAVMAISRRIASGAPEPPPDPAEAEGLAEARRDQADPFDERRLYAASTLSDWPVGWPL